MLVRAHSLAYRSSYRLTLVSANACIVSVTNTKMMPWPQTQKEDSLHGQAVTGVNDNTLKQSSEQMFNDTNTLWRVSSVAQKLDGTNSQIETYSKGQTLSVQHKHSDGQTLNGTNTQRETRSMGQTLSGTNTQWDKHSMGHTLK